MTRWLPPAGHPLDGAMIHAAAQGSASRTVAEEELIHRLEGLFPDRVALPLSSGRAALTLLFETCRRLAPDRDEVVTGAYTCWSVAAAAVRAGLRIRPVDIDPSTLDFDWESLRREDLSTVCCLVTHHLFGLPNDLEAIEEIARAAGVLLIDDAAQGLGASFDGRRIGSGGDCGLISFGRGKGLPALVGGAALTGRDSVFARELRRPADGGGGASAARARAMLHRFFFHPERYAIPASLPFLQIGKTVYEENFSIQRIDGFSASLASRLLEDLDGRADSRRETAAHYDRLIQGIPSIRRIRPLDRGIPVYIRYPVLVPPDRRAILLQSCRRLGVAEGYPKPIHEIPGLPAERIRMTAPLPGAEEIARSLVTFPTHPLVREEEREAIVRRTGEVCG